VRRLGSEHEAVYIYAIAPPASSERVLRIDARLRAKLGVASRVVGLDASFAANASSIDAAPPELASNILMAVTRWQRSEIPAPVCTEPHYAGVLAPNDGLLALVAVGEERLLLAQVDGSEPSLDASIVTHAIAMCDGPAMPVATADRVSAERILNEWCERWCARQRLSLRSPAGARTRARVGGRLTAFLNDAPRSERAGLSAIVSRARRVLSLPLGAAAEARLARLAEASRVNAVWLNDVAVLAVRPVASHSELGATPLAVIVLRRRS
jgi:hypothetical protein